MYISGWTGKGKYVESERILIVKVKVKGWDAENQKEAETCQRVVRRSVEWQ